MLSDLKTALQKHLDAVMKRNEEDYLSIHLACKYWFPDEVLKCVIDANVEMAKEKDNEGLYPLQIECCENGKPCSIAYKLSSFLNFIFYIMSFQHIKFKHKNLSISKNFNT